MKIMNDTKLRMLLPVLAVITAVFLLSPSVAYAAGNGEAVSPSDAVFDDMEYSETEVSEEDEEVSEEDEEIYSEEDEIVSDSDADSDDTEEGEIVSDSDADSDDTEEGEIVSDSDADSDDTEEGEIVSDSDTDSDDIEEGKIVSDSDASAVIPGEVKWLPNSYKGFPVIPEKAAESPDVIASPATGEEGEPWVCLALMNLSALAACAVRFGKGAESLKKLGKALKGQ